MTAIIGGALVITVVVFVHELGHLVAARMAGVRVKSFSIGLGPVLLKRRHGATEYRLSALPLGGYVRLAGQSSFDPAIDEDIPAAELFRTKSRLTRLGIYLAGPAANLALALMLLTITYCQTSTRQRKTSRSLRIASVTPKPFRSILGVGFLARSVI